MHERQVLRLGPVELFRELPLHDRHRHDEVPELGGAVVPEQPRPGRPALRQRRQCIDLLHSRPEPPDDRLDVLLAQQGEAVIFHELLTLPLRLSYSEQAGREVGVETPAFEGFFRVMYPKLVRYAQRRVDPAVAEDLAAMTLEAIWVKDVPAPRDEVGQRKLQSFAYRILDGHLRNAQRAAATHRNALQSLAAQDTGRSEVADVADQVVAPTWPDWAEPLSMTDRDVLELLVDGYRVAEIAVILDCTPAAVTMRLQRSKKNARLLWFREVNREQEA